jgi:hypothetical protein
MSGVTVSPIDKVRAKQKTKSKQLTSQTLLR